MAKRNYRWRNMRTASCRKCGRHTGDPDKPLCRSCYAKVAAAQKTVVRAPTRGLARPVAGGVMVQTLRGPVRYADSGWTQSEWQLIRDAMARCRS